MLGHQVVRGLADSFDVSATVRSLSVAEQHGLPGKIFEWDATQLDVLGELLDELRPDYVVNCIGIIKQSDAAASPILSIEVNSLLPHQIAAACKESGSSFVHISTDCVFSGQKPFPDRYTEQDRPDSTDLYGRSKLVGETTPEEGLTIRTSIIGRELVRETGLLEWFLSQAGGAVDGFSEAWFSGLTTAALTRVLAQLFEQESAISGVYQVASDPINKFDLLGRLRDAFGLKVEVRESSSLAINRSLDGSRFGAETQIVVPSWDQMIADLAHG